MDGRKILVIMALCLLAANAAADLRDDAYGESCPAATDIIRSALQQLYASDNTIAPALLRLFFHDCFVMGCDASILLDSDSSIRSEKDAQPNLTVRGFKEIDAIKAILEQECPGVVSCSDVIVLAARESVVIAGGEFYPVLTGGLDSKTAFFHNVSKDIPSPGFNLTQALEAFVAKGFDAGEMVALLGGGHSTGKIHGGFIQRRLIGPDPSINPEFLKLLRSECQSEERGIPMDYEGPGNGFGEVYFRSLLQGKGLLFVDQHLMSGMPTRSLVGTYAADLPLFNKDFGTAMGKLSNLQGPSEEDGEVRRHCRSPN